jgi:hypothetical protein
MNRVLFCIILIVTLTSCRDVFEKDISQENVKIISPNDNTITENLNVTFQWSEIEGATSYQIEVVSPRFDTAHTIKFDSLVETNSLSLSLNPGNYQWKVRGKNNAYQTSYSTAFSLTIDSSYNLNNQTIVLNTPSTNLYLNTDQITFYWQNLYAVSSYNIVVKSGTDWSSGIEVVNDFSTSNSYPITTSLVEGAYHWAVNGSNSLPSNTPFSESSVFYLDFTSPPAPVLVSPDQTTTGLIADSVHLFNWTRPTDVGGIQSPRFDSLMIYTDTLILPIYSYYSAIEDLEVVLPSAGTYFWRAITYDEAGNASDVSNTNMFTVQ